MTRVYQLNEAEALLAFQQVKDHCSALKNWIVAAVEERDWDRATKLASEVRAHEMLYAKLNVEAHRQIDARRQEES